MQVFLICMCAADDISVSCNGGFVSWELMAVCTKKSRKATFNWSTVARLW